MWPIVVPSLQVRCYSNKLTHFLSCQSCKFQIKPAFKGPLAISDRVAINNRASTVAAFFIKNKNQP